MTFLDLLVHHRSVQFFFCFCFCFFEGSLRETRAGNTYCVPCLCLPNESMAALGGMRRKDEGGEKMRRRVEGGEGGEGGGAPCLRLRRDMAGR